MPWGLVNQSWSIGCAGFEPSDQARHDKKVKLGLPEQFSIIERLEESYAVQRLRRVFEVYRSSYRAWRDRDREPCEAEKALLDEVVEAHAVSNGSAGARSR